MKKRLTACISLLGIIAAQPIFAAHLDISVTNLTQNIAFTPLLISAHDQQGLIFSLGKQASPELQAMAEGGALDGLVMQTEAAMATNLVNIAQGPLLPAHSATSMGFDTADHKMLSLVAMLLPTNDGFVGLDSWAIPSASGTYTLWLSGYDAGTEANDERVVEGGGVPGTPGIPDAPIFEHGTAGSGMTTAIPNDRIHIHPGNLGDGDAGGGLSDLSNTVHRWLNPVAKLTVKVH